MFTLIERLHRTGLLSVAGVARLLEALTTTGVNLMAVLRLAARLHPRRLAVIDDRERLTYPELWRQAECLAAGLHEDFGVRAGQKIAIVCRNHAAAVKAIFAFSRLGAHVFLVNPEMSTDQLRALADRFRFDFCVYDEELAGVFDHPAFPNKALRAYHPTGPSVDRLASSGPKLTRLKRVKSGNLVVMTGGTTGQPKPASRRPSVFDFLPPFVALLDQVRLDRYRSLYLATPVYHGFGLAALIIGVLLGAELYLTRRFDAANACALVAENRVEVVTLVPLMLERMLKRSALSLLSLRRILSGGAALSPALATETLDRLGPVLFNLYGTSEAGYCVLATPELIRRKPASIGKPVRGVRTRVVNETGQEVVNGAVGRLGVRCAWGTDRKGWTETGDLAFRDPDGDLFLCGRSDDMIVSGGENVYPVELEHVLVQHPDVSSAAVVGIPDAEFGQRLKAVVVKKQDAALDAPALLDWLKPRVARYQVPAVIEFREELAYTALGKVDKKALRG